MNGLEDNAKRFALSSSPFIKELMFFSLSEGRNFPIMRTERWTWVVACAHNLLVLARPQVVGCYRPWEARRSVLTLVQVRRAMSTLLHQLGTPARSPQRRGKAPGRAKGFHPKPRVRHPVIRKTSKKQKKSKKTTSV